MGWHSHLLKNFPHFIVIHTVKGFGVVNETEVEVFLEFSCFFDAPTDVGNLFSGSSAFSKLRVLIVLLVLFLSFDVYFLTSLVAQTVKRLPAMWETQVRSLGWEDPLEKEKATRSSTLAWNISWMEEPGRLPSMGLQKVGHD